MTNNLQKSENKDESQQLKSDSSVKSSSDNNLQNQDDNFDSYNILFNNLTRNFRAQTPLVIFDAHVRHRRNKSHNRPKHNSELYSPKPRPLGEEDEYFLSPLVLDEVISVHRRRGFSLCSVNHQYEPVNETDGDYDIKDKTLKKMRKDITKIKHLIPRLMSIRIDDNQNNYREEYNKEVEIDLYPKFKKYEEDEVNDKLDDDEDNDDDNEIDDENDNENIDDNNRDDNVEENEDYSSIAVSQMKNKIIIHNQSKQECQKNSEKEIIELKETNGINKRKNHNKKEGKDTILKILVKNNFG